MPTDPLSTLAVATGGAFLGKFVGPAAEHYGRLALERAQQLGQKATAYLAAVGREPQSVEPKLLVPLVQAAALESDESLADKWAALLANAADPASRTNVQPAFVEILRQLTPLDAQTLEALYNASEDIGTEETSFSYCYTSQIQQVVDNGARPFSVAFRIAVDNLLRLRLCEGRNMIRPGAGSGKEIMSKFLAGQEATLADSPGKERLAMTDLGYAFFMAVTPPTP